MGFPTQVNVQPAVAVEGDFASANPRFTVDAGPGGLVAGSNGVTVGRFAWADSTGLVSSNGAGAPTGFVHREQQALITAFLGGSTMLVPQGLPVTLFSGGDFWVKNAGSGSSAIGQKAYANNADGSVTFGATSTPTQGGTGSASTIDVNITTATSSRTAVNTTTASITGTTMTVSAVGTGTVLAKGQTLAGGSSVTGYVDPATTIVAQLTGTAGSTGTYQVSVSQNVTSTTITATGGGLTIAGVTTGLFYVGQVVSGTGIVTGTKIAALGTGAGGVGTYALDTAPSAPSAAVTVTGAGGLLTVGGTVTGTYSVGDVIYGAGVTAGSTILANATTTGLTGTGGAGTYIVSVGDTVGSEAINAYKNTETKWYAMSVGAPGELVKMSAQPLG